MKAVMYAIRRDGGWEAGFSIAWEVDRMYWGNSAFRRTVTRIWGADAKHAELSGGESGHPFTSDRHERCIRLEQTVPLGLAETACRWWNERWPNARDGEVRNSLIEAVRWAAAGAGEPEAATGLRECEVVMADMENGSGDGGAVALARFARQAAERLSGCSLLYAEALAALGAGESELRAAIRLAELLGGIRIAAAVAPEVPSERGRRRGRLAAAMRCRRCGGGEEQLRRTPCATCGRRRCAYCEGCLTMGRSRECGLLAIGAPAAAVSMTGTRNIPGTGHNHAELGNRHRSAYVDADFLGGLSRTSSPAERWGLSLPQQDAAAAALAYLRRTIGSFLVPAAAAQRDVRADGPLGAGRSSAPVRASFCMHRLFRRLPSLLHRLLPAASPDPRIFLLWAVTGAGKTEMTFPLLDAVLSSGGKAAVATPRRDVVLELAPRLAAAFPGMRLTVLYGGSEDKFAIGDLTLATTHQLIRFREAFDLVVIDEVDAFPYHHDAALHYAAANARARCGMTLLLSATPPPAMQRLARRGRLPHARVAVRHHRRPLPVPRRLAIPPLARWTAAAAQGGRPNLPARLIRALRASVRRGAQLFLFVPYIRQVEPLVRLLRLHAPAFGIDPAAIDGTSSQDAGRGEKVRRFRARTIRMLVTTTILERGVTIPRSDVFVLDADKPLFDAASLVQMAGRAGRSADDPHGCVCFAAAAWTQSQREACRQIREMNAYARRRGYLLDDDKTAGSSSAREVAK